MAKKSGRNNEGTVVYRVTSSPGLFPQKMGRAVHLKVDSNPSVNILFNIRKILCNYPRKRKDISSLQCRRILGGRNLVRVRNIVVASIFDFMTVEDWGEDSPHFLLSSGSFNMALSRANCALKENACTAG